MPGVKFACMPLVLLSLLAAGTGSAEAQCRSGQRGGLRTGAPSSGGRNLFGTQQNRSLLTTPQAFNPLLLAAQQQNLALLAAAAQQQNPALLALQQQNVVLAAALQQQQQQNAVLAAALQQQQAAIRQRNLQVLGLR